MNKISIRGVVVGGITDVVATLILTLPLVIYIIEPSAPKGPTAAEVMGVIRANPLLYFLQALIGLACSVLGGYVAARVAQHDELLNGMLASFLPVTLGVYSLATSKDQGPVLLPLLLLVASPLCSRLGGHLRLVQIRGPVADSQSDVGLREHDLLEGARHALQKVGNGVVDFKQIESIRAERRSVLGATLQASLWKIALSAFFWIIALIVVAAFMSNAGIDLFGVLKKLSG